MPTRKKDTMKGALTDERITRGVVENKGSLVYPTGLLEGGGKKTKKGPEGEENRRRRGWNENRVSRGVIPCPSGSFQEEAPSF